MTVADQLYSGVFRGHISIGLFIIYVFFAVQKLQLLIVEIGSEF